MKIMKIKVTPTRFNPTRETDEYDVLTSTLPLNQQVKTTRFNLNRLLPVGHRKRGDVGLFV